MTNEMLIKRVLQLKKELSNLWDDYQDYDDGVLLDLAVSRLRKANALAEALGDIQRWFKELKSEQYERLFHNQTLESASANWDLPSDVKEFNMGKVDVALSAWREDKPDES